MFRGLAAGVLAAAALSGLACDDDGAGDAAAAEASAAPATAPGAPGTGEATGSGGDTGAAAPQPTVLPAPPSYPDTLQGLEGLMTALVVAIQNDDAGEEARLLASMRLPDPQAWFEAHFDRKLAGRLRDEYRPLHDGIGRMVTVLKPPVTAGQTVVRAEKFEAPDQLGATGYQRAALIAMKKKVPLYSVRLSTPDRKKVFHLWSFVHHEGTFRFVGKMKKVDSGAPPTSGRDPLEYRQSDRERVTAADDAR
ncbi:MAG TPA: hypothetical protein VKZ63_09765 [Kofleriaceae bacterium]|nr:hypothetical protein [Kofleriaceae bacterium]